MRLFDLVTQKQRWISVFCCLPWSTSLFHSQSSITLLKTEIFGRFGSASKPFATRINRWLKLRFFSRFFYIARIWLLQSNLFNILIEKWESDLSYQSSSLRTKLWKLWPFWGRQFSRCSCTVIQSGAKNPDIWRIFEGQKMSGVPTPNYRQLGSYYWQVLHEN